MSALVITDTARAQMVSYLKRVGATQLHFGISGKGCGGFSYVIQTYEAERDGDIVHREHLERENEISCFELVVDSASFVFVIGTVIDYVENAMGGAYAFKNPQAVGTCGCGTSFSI